ncbi:helix-turn-helix domain-containing protein [Cedecea lapagei]|uniref:helix-turn-helix domain-containing protein n=1 Tax=Cedecea lapagei TaxID=158823 RepID=UPI000F828FFD|nr:helix-turn-helix domain-containing protein [Cedecea lapagei]
MGRDSSTWANALTRPWLKGEYLIAQAFEVHLNGIWPELCVGEDGEIVERKRVMRRNRELVR